MSDLIRVLVADDHPVVRQGLVSIITPGHGMQVVGEAANGVEAVAQARTAARRDSDGLADAVQDRAPSYHGDKRAEPSDPDPGVD